MSTYIKLEDVQKILSKTSDKYQSEYTGGWIVSKIQEELNSLTSIEPQGIIQEMIKDFVIIDDHDEGYRDAIISVLEKLPK